MIDDMVNWAMFVKDDRASQVVQTFSTDEHCRMFTVLLGDFLSEVKAFKGEPAPLGLLSPPSNARPSDMTFLFHLRQVCAVPQMGTDVADLRAAETEFIAKGINLMA